MNAPGNDVGKINNVSLGLRNFGTFNLYMRAVHPESGKRMPARYDLGLGNFIVVVHGDMLNSSRMDVYLFSESRANHRRTLYVPSREPFSPRAVPPERTIQFPKNKVCRIPLVGAYPEPRPLFYIFKINFAERPVGREAGGVVIDTVFCRVRIPFFHH